MTGEFATVEVARGVWCRWASQAAALRLRPGLSPAPLGPGTPAWRWQEHHAGWRLLESLLRELGGQALPATIGLAGNGKPVLANAPEVGISISHSYPVVAAAVGLGWEVGVDTEVEAGRPDGAAAWQTQLALPARARDWTVREACVKATGAGLAGRPWRIPVGIADAGRWQNVRWRYLRHEAPIPLSVAWRAAAATRTTGMEGSRTS